MGPRIDTSSILRCTQSSLYYHLNIGSKICTAITAIVSNCQQVQKFPHKLPKINRLQITQMHKISFIHSEPNQAPHTHKTYQANRVKNLNTTIAKPNHQFTILNPKV